MIRTLIFKILRDVRLPLFIVAGLLMAFECLWAKITQRITQELLPNLGPLSVDVLLRVFFEGPGQIIQALIGGEMIDPTKPLDVITIGYVHPLAQTILCVWAIGRGAGAITGEIDRGTMELLLAQPLARTKVVLAHLCVDVMVIPFLCLAMWAGSWLGIAWFGKVTLSPDGPRAAGMQINPLVLLPALPNVAALLFAVSGITIWLSSRGRFRGRVLGTAVLVMLLQFLINLIGQLWPAAAPLRPFMLFYYFQPQQVILTDRWTMNVGRAWSLGHAVNVNVLVVLAAVGVAGYGLALWTFTRRDVPAPL